MHNFPTRIKGISNKEAGFDHELRFNCTKEAVLRFGWDFAATNDVVASDFFASVGNRQIRWAGGDLPDDAPYQWVEDEYMRADEYDEFLADPNGFTVRKLFPRMAEGLEGLGQIPLPPLFWLSNSYYFQVAGNLLATPPLKKVLLSLVALSEAAEKNSMASAAYVREMKELGYPNTWAAAVFPAFDMVSDTFRGLRGAMLDMYRQPDRLLAAIDRCHEAVLGICMLAAQISGNPRQFIPMHKGAGGFMTDEQFATFYWPSFKKLIEELVAHGITPMPLFEGDYTPRLEYLAQLPPGKVAGHFDKIDRKRFKEICGDTMCFWGNVPNSLMVTGTPQQVKRTSRRSSTSSAIPAR